MKTITIPAAAELTRLSAEQAFDLLPVLGSKLRIDTVNWPNEYPYAPQTEVTLAHTSEALYIRYDVEGKQLRAVAAADQGEVWCDSCVEFFCQPENDTHYQNYETNCIGTVLSSRRLGRSEDVVLRTEQQMQQISRYSTLGREPFEEKDGEYTWSVCIAIPLSLITGQEENAFPLRLRGNFYKCADATKCVHFVSWNPIETAQPDFHCPRYFGSIVLEA